MDHARAFSGLADLESRVDTHRARARDPGSAILIKSWRLTAFLLAILLLTAGACAAADDKTGDDEAIGQMVLWHFDVGQADATLISDSSSASKTHLSSIRCFSLPQISGIILRSSRQQQNRIVMANLAHDPTGSTLELK